MGKHEENSSETFYDLVKEVRRFGGNTIDSDAYEQRKIYSAVLKG